MTDPLASIRRRQQRDLRLLYTTMADAIENAVARQLEGRDPAEPITDADRRAIMREVGEALDVIWGRHPGDPDAALRTVALRDTDLARLEPLDAAVRDWRRVMPRRLREAIEAEAKRE